MDWETVTIAGAFIGGIVLGGVGVIRVFRYVLAYVRRENEDPDRTPR